MNDLYDGDEKHVNYFRFCREHFAEVLFFIGSDIQRVNTRLSTD